MSCVYLTHIASLLFFFFFFFNDTATTEIYTLSLHDALPIYCHEQSYGSHWSLRLREVHASPHSQPHARNGSRRAPGGRDRFGWQQHFWPGCDFSSPPKMLLDRKSTRLNSSHGYISYAVFCLKKKIT